MAEIKITKTNFDEKVLNSAAPVLLDFWATWCGPCKMIAPVLQELVEKYDQITVGKVNVDEEMELAARYQISSIPTLLLVKGGAVVDKVVGYMPFETLEGWLRSREAI